MTAGQSSAAISAGVIFARAARVNTAVAVRPAPASIEVGGDELLVTGMPGDNPMLWGSYPMVPFAGRIRDGRFTWGDRTVQLPINLEPHAIHGTGFTSAWDVVDQGLDHVELQCALTWPLGGRAHQHLQLTRDALVCVGGLCTASTTATHQPERATA